MKHESSLASHNEQIITMACQLKREQCADNTNMSPCVVFNTGNEYACFSYRMNGHPVDNLPIALSAAVDQGFTKFDTISFVSDGYVNFFENTTALELEASNYERGDFKHEFENNAETHVKEVLMVITYGWNGGRYESMTSYGIDDNGVPQFTQVKVGNARDSVAGFVLTTFIEFCQHRETS